jgi:hypothetical protein
MSTPFADSGFNPFLSANQFIASQYKSGLKNYQKQLKSRVQGDAESMHQAQYRTLPTPANTGAPVPGYKQRGSYITPSTTGAPMPGTLKNNTAIHPVTQAKVPSVPVKTKGAKPTPAGTKPKK